MLTPEQIRFYHENGFLTGLPIGDAARADAYRRQFDALEAVEGRDKTRIGLLDRHFDQPFLWELATDSAILDTVEALIGPDILLLATHFFCKYGRDEKWVAWHQDITYWGLEPPQAITAWYAVDAADAENGCMRFLPGTHRSGIRVHGKAAGAGNLLSVNQEAPVTGDEAARAVNIVLPAGSISLHDGALIHGSLPNRSDRRRCGLTLRYVPASVQPAGANSMDRHWDAVLVRGEDRYGHFGRRAQPFR